MFGLGRILGRRKAEMEQRQAECIHEFEERKMIGVSYFKCSLCSVRIHPADYPKYMQQRKELMKQYNRMNRGGSRGGGRRARRRGSRR